MLGALVNGVFPMTAVTASRIFWPVSPPQQTRLAAATLILVLVTVTGLLFDFFTGSHAILLATGFYDRVHRNLLKLAFLQSRPMRSNG